MDSSIIHLSIEGDHNEGFKHVRTARIMVDELRQSLGLAGLTTGARHHRIDDNSYIYARVGNGINAVRIVMPYLDETIEIAEEVIPEFIKTETAMPTFLSGHITGAEIVETADQLGNKLNRLSKFRPTPECQQKHKLSPDLQLNARLAVKGYADLSAVKDTDFRRYSQHAGVRPTMYSGVMKQVVQLLLGYGKPEGGMFFDRAQLYKIKMAGMAEGRSDIPRATGYEQEVLKNGYQVRYDYRNYRTHGIVFGSDKKPWLVEIGITRGIVAMPLPLYPSTTTEEFREVMEEKGDYEMLAVLELLGGMPTGESFPVKQSDFNALVRSGDILRLASVGDLQRYYGRLTPYSSALGWAFNESGTEAHNTGYAYADDGWQFGEHYEINLSIGQEQDNPIPSYRIRVMAKVNEAGYGSRSAIEIQAIKNKINRLDGSTLFNLYVLSSNQLVAAVDSIEIAPPLSATASFTLAGSGRIIKTGSPNAYTLTHQIKFYEPLFEGGAIISHIFLPMEGARSAPEVVSDTTMLVFFNGNQLCWAKWFRDPRSKPVNDVESDEEPCMYFGSWTHTHRTGNRGITQGFYTSEYDDRFERADYTTTRNTESRYLGISQVAFSDHIDDIRKASVWRTHRFRKKTVTDFDESKSLLTAVVMPAFGREAMYYCSKVTTSLAKRHISHGYDYLTDPHFGETWRVMVSTAGFAVARECADDSQRRVLYLYHAFNDGKSPQGMNRPVAVGSCSQLVDQGSWLRKCQAVENLTYSIPAPTLPAFQATNPDPVYEWKVYLNCSFFDEVKIDSEADKWFAQSPDDFGFIQYMWVSGNTFGDVESVTYSREPNGNILHKGSPKHPEVLETFPCFIGVVNA